MFYDTTQTKKVKRILVILKNRWKVYHDNYIENMFQNKDLLKAEDIVQTCNGAMYNPDYRSEAEHITELFSNLIMAPVSAAEIYALDIEAFIKPICKDSNIINTAGEPANKPKLELLQGGKSEEMKLENQLEKDS